MIKELLLLLIILLVILLLAYAFYLTLGYSYDNGYNDGIVDTLKELDEWLEGHDYPDVIKDMVKDYLKGDN